MLRDRDHVLHELHGLLEHVGVDALQNILFSAFRADQKRIVDVAVSERLAADRLAFDLKLVDGLLHEDLRLNIYNFIWYFLVLPLIFRIIAGFREKSNPFF